MGNGLVAIMASLFANTFADNLGFGPVSVIEVATCFLGIVMVNEIPYRLSLNGVITPLRYWFIMFYLYKKIPNLPPFVTFHILVMVKKHRYPPLLFI